MPYPEHLTTDRLQLRPLRPTDAAVLHERLLTDPRVSHYLTWSPPATLEETRDRVTAIAEAASGGDEVTWVVTGRADDRPIGMFTVWSTEHGQELGYCLAPEVWGQGLMTEAVAAVTDRLLAAEGVVRVWATCDVENATSVRVLEKAGFTREGLLRRLAVHPNISQEHRDCLLYARVR